MRYQQTEQRPQAPLANGPRPASDDAMAKAARAALDAAVDVARAGDRQSARELCAAAIYDAQPVIAARPDLLRAAIHALLTADGFRLLSRLVLAVSGRVVHVTLLAECGGPIAGPRGREEAGRTVYALDSRWLDRLSPDDMLLRHWCDALISRRPSRLDLPGVAPVARHLEPV